MKILSKKKNLFSSEVGFPALTQTTNEKSCDKTKFKDTKLPLKDIQSEAVKEEAANMQQDWIIACYKLLLLQGQWVDTVFWTST